MKKISGLLLVMFLSINIEAFAQTEDGGKSVSADFLLSELILQILATIIIVIIIKKYAWEKFLNMLEERRKDINNSILTARKSKEKALTLETQKEEELMQIKSKTKGIIEDSKKQAKDEQSKIVQHAKQKAENILEKANKEVVDQREALQKELTNELAQVSISIAQKFLKENMSEEMERELINSALKEVKND